jgi:hypothetical protein
MGCRALVKRQLQMQMQQQIPFGDDNQKSNGKSDGDRRFRAEGVFAR